MAKTTIATAQARQQGRYRPVVGRIESGKPQRFQVGRVKDTTAAEAQRRLDYIRLLYDRQCQDENIDYWAGSMLPWAIRLANGPIKVYGSSYSKTNPGQAAEEVSNVFRLQSWGLPVQIVDYDLQASGNAFIKSKSKSRSIGQSRSPSKNLARNGTTPR